MSAQCGFCNTGQHDRCAHGVLVVWHPPDSKTELRTVLTCECTHQTT